MAGPERDDKLASSGDLSSEARAPDNTEQESNNLRTPDAAVRTPVDPELSSGRVRVSPTEAVIGPARSRRLSDAVSGGVEAIGTGIGTIGEGVSKLGDLTTNVPLVGSSVGKLGDGLTRAGESIHALPRVARTRRGRVLVRSVIVGFMLVAAWIAVIVGWQLRGEPLLDFRPNAEHILVEISKGDGAIREVFEKASPRFQEMVPKDRFVDDMLDLNATVGSFKEITAINDTLVTTGPTGRVGRVSLTAAYTRGVCKGSISFHWHQSQWKLLGVGLELPAELKITQAMREQRVAACKDPNNRATCDVRNAAESVLERLRDGNAGEVWDQASEVFQKQQTRLKFAAIVSEHLRVLGAYRRILRVTEAKMMGNSASFDVVVEFERANGVRIVFGFERASKTVPWQLYSFKLVMPMPRVDDGK